MPSVKENIVLRKFLTLEGEVLEEAEWAPKPIDKCFYCDIPLTTIDSEYEPCWDSQNLCHDWITLVNPTEFRR